MHSAESLIRRGKRSYSRKERYCGANLKVLSGVGMLMSLGALGFLSLCVSTAEENLAELIPLSDLPPAPCHSVNYRATIDKLSAQCADPSAGSTERLDDHSPNL